MFSKVLLLITHTVSWIFVLSWCDTSLITCSSVPQQRQIIVSAFVATTTRSRKQVAVPKHYQEESASSLPLILYSSSSDETESINNEDSEAARLKEKAEKLRDEIRSLEETLNNQNPLRSSRADFINKRADDEIQDSIMSLKGKTVLVVGANGRLGSMVCRYLLRNNPKTQVVAAVHYVGEASTRGYGRLSYEVGAEDGQGSIGAAWDSQERNAYFQFTDEMKSYNLQNLRVVEVELLDPVQCMTITEDVDCVIWCATDFDRNTPRAVSGLNFAFLFRAVASPTKGRVEIEGLTNILGGLKNSKQSRKWNADRTSAAAAEGSVPIREEATLDKLNDPVSFVLVSASESAFDDFETPFGSFKGLKRDGERIATQQFPSLSTCVLRMSQYDDNFVGEDLDITKQSSEDDNGDEHRRRRINRRDAARAAVEALRDQTCRGKIVDVWTAIRRHRCNNKISY